MAMPMLAVTKCSLSGDHERARKHGTDPLGHLVASVLPGNVLEQDPELVAAEAGHGVAGADGLRSAGRAAASSSSPTVVAEAVVDELEVVEVEEQDGAQGLAAPQPGQGLLHPVQEQNPVGQPVRGSCSAR